MNDECPPIEFQWGGTLTIDRMGVERQTDTAKYRAYYNAYDDGTVDVTRIERWQLGAWMPDDLGDEFEAELKSELEEQIEREQQTMVASYDEERRRVG